MLKKLLNLTRNELTKQYKKISIKVIIAITLIFALALPLILNSTKNNDKNFMMNSHKYNLTSIESRIAELSKIDKTENKIEKAFLEAEKESVKLSIDNNLDYHDWRNNEVLSYSQISSKIVIINSILNGINENIVMTNASKSANPIEAEELQSYLKLSKEELKSKKDALTKEKEEIKKTIKSNDYIAYVKKSIKNRDLTIKNTNTEIANLEKKLNTNKKEISNQIASLKENLNTEKSLLKLDEYRLKNKITYEKDNWRSNTLEEMSSSINALNTPMMSKEEFRKNPPEYMGMGKTYEDYKQIYSENKKKNQDNIKLGWYSLNNNIPQLDFDNGARGMTKATYELFIMLSAIISIIIAGGIVSSEFSKGTVRLLLIRPASRFKILLSKLVSVFLIGYGVMFLSILVLVISGGFVMGFDSLSINVLSVVDGNVVEKSYFMYLLSNILFSSISVIFVISLSFMISTIVKSTALSVGLSSILYLGSLPITFIIANFKLGSITKFVLGYINLSIFKLIPEFANMMKGSFGVTLDVKSGAIQLAVLSVIFIVASFITFLKSDIKN
ncbi:ABC transporter permease [Clostridium cylindrosporum]|uniref:ABC-type transport system involved in multi-copper enzyme maturation, permease component n=1 Tax=Clostridium cylindrosporum DSM 605 TaxID=1121307 RepID=A0A0J8DC92_CLOCY|nr:ABC transporter permease [Clostridium cylindrosporum]KMT21924.1 ABC-type transport system involved in multi-copper enzyme maturation, permease component [Clostridium cylindrosporum DSM 605]